MLAFAPQLKANQMGWARSRPAAHFPAMIGAISFPVMCFAGFRAVRDPTPCKDPNDHSYRYLHDHSSWQHRSRFLGAGPMVGAWRCLA